MVAFRYLKDFEQEERILTHAKRQIKTTWRKLEGNLILFHYREYWENLYKRSKKDQITLEDTELPIPGSV